MELIGFLREEHTANTGATVLVWRDSVTPNAIELEFATTAFLGPTLDMGELRAVYDYGGGSDCERYALSSGLYVDSAGESLYPPSETLRTDEQDYLTAAAQHPDGEQWVVRTTTPSGATGLYKAHATGYAVLATVEAAFRSGYNAVSPNGEFVAVSCYQQYPAAPAAMLRVFAWGSGSEVSLGSWWLACGMTAIPDNVTGVAWSPDSALLAVSYHSDEFGYSTDHVVVLDAATGALVAGPRAINTGGYRADIAVRGWSGSRIVVAVTHGVAAPGDPATGPVQVLEVDGAALVPVGNVNTTTAGYPDWCVVIPNTDVIALFDDGANTLTIYSIVDGTPQYVLNDGGTGIFSDQYFRMMALPALPPPPVVFWKHLVRCREVP